MLGKIIFFLCNSKVEKKVYSISVPDFSVLLPMNGCTHRDEWTKDWMNELQTNRCWNGIGKGKATQMGGEKTVWRLICKSNIRGKLEIKEKQCKANRTQSTGCLFEENPFWLLLQQTTKLTSDNDKHRKINILSACGRKLLY